MLLAGTAWSADPRHDDPVTVIDDPRHDDEMRRLVDEMHHEQAVKAVENMSDENRATFFAYLKKKYQCQF
jgi:Mg/Co/Ni transporter MgtE